MIRMRVLFGVSILVTVFVVFFYLFNIIDGGKYRSAARRPPRMRQHVFGNGTNAEKVIKLDYDYNLWLIFTKVIDKSPLMYNFNGLITNLLNVSSAELRFHVIVDDDSKPIAVQQVAKISNATRRKVRCVYYDVRAFAKDIEDIVEAMTPFFSSRPGTYYSDALFYISLGLYRVAPKEQNRAIMLDCDVFFKDDIVKLFKQFDGFTETNLFGLSPELSPVYHHVLYNYKQKHNTTFGEYYRDSKIGEGAHPRGFQGYNSGVILFDFAALRNSTEYAEAIEKASIKKMTAKYRFRGHLGDQDFYTLLGYERPHLIRTLNCGFNRQLCTWWRDRGGYKDIFDNYFRCKHKAVVLHGNCNTKLN